MLTRSCLLAILVLLIPVSWATAVTRYVDQSCGDVSTYVPTAAVGSRCTGGNAVTRNTINEGVALTGTGDILYIRAGTYNERLNSNTVTFPFGNSWSDAPLISRYQNEVVTLRPSGGGDIIGVAISPVSPTVRYLIFNGLILDGVNTTSFSSNGIGSSGNNHHIRITNMEIKNTFALGILLSGTFWEILNNHIHHAGHGCSVPPCQHGLYIATATDTLISGNDIHDNEQFGAQIFVTGGGSHRNTFVGNKVYNNNTATNVSGGGLEIGSGDDNVAYNNIIYNNGAGIGISVDSYDPRRTLIYNNTVFGNGEGGIRIGVFSTPADTRIRSNIFYNNGNPQMSQTSGTNTTFSHNHCNSVLAGLCSSSGNPLFVNSGQGDFRVQSGSPVIDQGLNLAGVVSIDYAGVTRPQGAAFDIGAFEFVSAAPPEPFGNVAKYTFEGNVNDSSGQNNHGTLVGNATFGAGIIGSQSLSLDGAGDYVTVPDAASLKPTSGVCLSAWIKPTVGGNNAWAIISKGARYQMYGDSEGQLSGFFYDGTNWPIVYTTDATLLDGAAHHVVYTFDGTTQLLYVDNVQKASLASPGPIVHPGSEALLIGREPGSTTRDYKGLIDQPYIFDENCSSSAVTNLYNENVPVISVSSPHMAWISPTFDNILGSVDTARNHRIDQTLAVRVSIANGGTEITEFFPLTVCDVANCESDVDWIEVTGTANALGLVLEIDPSFDMGDSTTTMLPLGGFTSTQGRYVTPTINETVKTALVAGTITEWEYRRIRFTSPAAPGKQYKFRVLRENRTPFPTYASTPILTLASSNIGLAFSGVSSSGVANR